METGAAKTEIKNWILKKNGKIQPTELADDTPILEKRIISSLHVMELILFLEKISGRKLNLNLLKPGVFQNINTIYTHFFEMKA